MMGMTDGNGERVGGIWSGDLHARKLQPHHMVDLALVGVANAHHGLLDRVGEIFANRDPRVRRHQKGDAPRLSKFERRHSVFVDEGLLNCGGIGPVGRENGGKLREQIQQTLCQIGAAVRFAGAVRHMGQPRTIDVDDSPTHVPKARIDADDPHARPCS